MGTAPRYSASATPPGEPSQPRPAMSGTGARRIAPRPKAADITRSGAAPPSIIRLASTV